MIRSELWKLPDGRHALILEASVDPKLLAADVFHKFRWTWTGSGEYVWADVHSALNGTPLVLKVTGSTSSVPAGTIQVRWDGLSLSTKVRAIKFWRDFTGDGLRESKDAVERGDVLLIPSRLFTEAAMCGYSEVMDYE